MTKHVGYKRDLAFDMIDISLLSNRDYMFMLLFYFLLGSLLSFTTNNLLSSSSSNNSRKKIQIELWTFEWMFFFLLLCTAFLFVVLQKRKKKTAKASSGVKCMKCQHFTSCSANKTLAFFFCMVHDIIIITEVFIWPFNSRWRFFFSSRKHIKAAFFFRSDTCCDGKMHFFFPLYISGQQRENMIQKTKNILTTLTESEI